MIHLQKPDLGLLALNINASTDLFDGNKAIEGNHLRWNFNPEMGFPKNGFTVQRYNIKVLSSDTQATHLDTNSGNASLLEWEYKINLPQNKNEALSRISEVLISPETRAKYDQAATDLIEIIKKLSETGNPEEMYNTFLTTDEAHTNGLKSGLRVMDVLMTASVDPYIARMLGLYVIDKEADPSLNYVYLIQGHWGGRAFSPKHLSFEKYDVRQGNLPLQFEGVKVIPDRRTVGVLTAVQSQFYDAHILVVGNAYPAFVMQFDYPIEEVVLSYELNSQAPEWILATGGEPVEYEDDGKLLRVFKRGATFKELSFLFLPGHTFRIFKISFRRRIGAIGNISNVFVLDPSGAKPLTRPTITRLENEQMPAILNELGEISNKISQVKISSFVPTPKVSEVLIPNESYRLKALAQIGQLNNPARIQFRKLSSSGIRNVLPSQLKDIGSPAIYRDNSPNQTLGDLLAYWPMDSHFKNLKDGIEATKIGTPQFVKPDDENLNSSKLLRIKSLDALSLKTQPYLKTLGANFTLNITITISHLCPINAAIIGNSTTNGFWWGIKKGTDGLYRMYLWINGTLIKGTIPIPIGERTQISASYDGSNVYFQHGGFGFLNSDEPIPAALGKVNVPTQDITIGAEIDPRDNSLTSSFVGDLSEISIWQRAVHLSEITSLLTNANSILPQQKDLAQLVFHDSKTYLLNKAEEQVVIDKTPPLKALSNEFTFFLWTRPEGGMTEPYPTLLGNNYRNGFWIGLAKSGDQYYLRFWLNGKKFQSRKKIKENEWSHLGVSYNGSKIKLYINGVLDSGIPANSIPLLNNDLAIAIGSEVSSSPTSPIRFPFNGLITDIQIWREAITFQQWQEKLGGVQLIDKFLENEMHYYGAWAIDLFGRISQYSSVKRIETDATPQYNPPVNLHAKFKPIMGEIVSKEEWTETLQGGKINKLGYILTTNIPYRGDIAKRLRGYDLTLKRKISYDVPSQTGEMEIVDRITEQSFEIFKASEAESSSFVQFIVKAVPFEQLRPQAGDFVSVEFDFFYQLKWGWTGIQQLYFKEISAFDLFEGRGIQNELSSSITVLENSPARDFGPKEFTVKIIDKVHDFVANEFNDKYCLIGPNKFKVINHTSGEEPEFKIKYTSEPLVTPRTGDVMRLTIPEGSNAHKNSEDTLILTGTSIPYSAIEPLSLSQIQEPQIHVMEATSESEMEESTVPLIVERKNLIKESSIDWFPLSKVYKISLSNFRKPSDYIQPEPKDYLPSAIVFYDKSASQNKWRSFYVLWHQWTSDTELVLYTTPGEKDEPLPEIDISPTCPLRFYIGKSFIHDGELTEFPTFTTGQSTEQFHLALSSKDDDGIKSELSRSTVMVAVNRKKPAPGPRPEVSIPDKADYYGKCKAYVDWSMYPVPIESLFYKVFRATEADIFTRDLEQRRTLQGFYRGLDQDQVFLDDVDFADWLLTQNQPSFLNLFPDVDSSQWHAVTPIWRKWADRFYPSLSNAGITELAARAGNEKAFKLLTGKPIRETSYVDEVNGIVNNRYYYRLKTLSDALSESSTWGEISEAVTTIAVKAPRKPVFTKVEAGDRAVTLQWSLNRESDFKEYVLYRAESKEELEDLRWWSTERDLRIVDRIPDPWIKTMNNGIKLPGDLSLSTVLGVYQLDEFDSEASPIENQPQALNYYTESSESSISTDESSPHQILGLRKIADGKAMVIVFEDALGEVKAFYQKHNDIPFVDSDLIPLTTYFYRLAARTHSNSVSMSSEIKTVIPVEQSPPDPILIEEATWQPVEGKLTLQVTWIIPEEEREIQLLRRNDKKNRWKIVANWMDASTGSFMDTNPEPYYNNEILIKTRRMGGTLISESPIETIMAYAY